MAAGSGAHRLSSDSDEACSAQTRMCGGGAWIAAIQALVPCTLMHELGSRRTGPEISKDKVLDSGPHFRRSQHNCLCRSGSLSPRGLRTKVRYGVCRLGIKQQTRRAGPDMRESGFRSGHMSWLVLQRLISVMEGASTSVSKPKKVHH